MHTTTRHPGRGFTLVEVLVALAIVALLLGILVPALSGVREQARRVVCSSNQRQMGLSLHMYADQSHGRLPASRFLDGNDFAPARPQDMVVVRVGEEATAARYFNNLRNPWDGLGLLYAEDYLPANPVYYCPSHTGDVRLETFQNKWEGDPGEIVANYHYRGQGPDGQRKLAMLPSTAALVSDSFRSLGELNHKGGFNVLSCDLSVDWLDDASNVVASRLARNASDDNDGGEPGNTTNELWNAMDSGATSPTGIPGNGL